MIENGNGTVLSGDQVVPHVLDSVQHTRGGGWRGGGEGLGRMGRVRATTEFSTYPGTQQLPGQSISLFIYFRKSNQIAIVCSGYHRGKSEGVRGECVV